MSLARQDWNLPAAGVPPEVRRQVLGHLDGHLVAPVMHALSSGEADIATSRGAAEILALAGLGATDGETPPAHPRRRARALAGRASTGTR